MVAPERQRQGLGEVLFRTWDRNVGASLGLGLSPSSHRLFQKLRWPDVGPVPCLVKPLTRRALPPRRVADGAEPAGVGGDAAVREVRRAARGRCSGEVRLIRRFDDSFTGCGTRLAPQFDLAVRRDAAYLNWKFVSPPHVRYAIAALHARRARRRATSSTATSHEPRGRVTLLVDFLVDPDDEDGARDAAALGRSRGAGRGLRQDPQLLPCTPASARCSSAKATSRRRRRWSSSSR